MSMNPVFIAMIVRLVAFQADDSGEKMSIMHLLKEATSIDALSGDERELTTARIAAMQASLHCFGDASRTAMSLREGGKRLATLRLIAEHCVVAGELTQAWRLVPDIKFDPSIVKLIVVAEAVAARREAAIAIFDRIAVPAERANALVDFGRLMIARRDRDTANRVFRAAIGQFQRLDNGGGDPVRRALAFRWGGENKEWDSSIALIRNRGVSSDAVSLIVAIGECESIDVALSLANTFPAPIRMEARVRLCSALIELIERGCAVDENSIVALVDQAPGIVDLHPRLVAAELKCRHFQLALMAARNTVDPGMKVDLLARVSRDAQSAGDREIATKALCLGTATSDGLVSEEDKVRAYGALARVERERGDFGASTAFAVRCVAHARGAIKNVHEGSVGGLLEALESACHETAAADLALESQELISSWQTLLDDPKCSDEVSGSDWEQIAAQYGRVYGIREALVWAAQRNGEQKREILLGIARAQGESGNGAKVLDWVDAVPPGARKAEIVLAACNGMLQRLSIEYDPKSSGQ